MSWINLAAIWITVLCLFLSLDLHNNLAAAAFSVAFVLEVINFNTSQR